MACAEDLRRLLECRGRLRAQASQNGVETWRLQQANAFVARVEAALGDASTATCVEVIAALRAGCSPLLERHAAAQRELTSLSAVDAALTFAEWRRRCWAMRLRCLEHIEEIFNAARCSP